MLGAALAAERYDRVLAVLAPAMIVSQYVLYALCHRLIRPKLNADAIKHHGSNGEITAAGWSQLWKDMSGYVWCCCFHIAFSTVAMYGAGSYVFGDATPERSALGGAHTSMCSCAAPPPRCAFRSPILSAIPLTGLGDFEEMLVSGDTDFLRLQETSGLLGSIFAALMASFLFYWFLGWDNDKLQVPPCWSEPLSMLVRCAHRRESTRRPFALCYTVALCHTVAQLFHHTAFIGVTFVLARRCSLAFVGICAMAMEGSSPALALMQIFRQLDGDCEQRAHNHRKRSRQRDGWL